MEKDRILGSDISSSSRFSRKFIIISATLLLLLIVVVVTAVLLGVFIGGKNATELYQLSVHNDGKVEQQTVQVNPKENIATFYIQSANLSSTVLLDFNTMLMVLRTNNLDSCYVRKMEGGNFTSLSDLSNSLKNLNGQPAQESDNSSSTSFIPGPEIFDRSLFSRSASLLCQDVRSFWLVQGDPNTREICRTWRSKILCIFNWCVTIKACISLSR
ncbi:uncharacterized protein LOC133343800 [Lethenteron reissneri]|uniref:uncharacterized protein LOC133343800 n=1 Tax=Lethenteron reissneri TaxID=7753 RepID=UPI002AB6DCFF|nr:uncharacterized protein LOC133343800 [Lethenteron reissneri]